MALDKNSLIELARANAKASLNPSVTFSVGDQKLSAEAMNETLLNEFKRLGGNPHDFDDNKNLIFQLLEVGLSEVLPKKVIQEYGQFADTQTFAQGTKPVFKLKVTEASRKRAKSFVTKVGLAGRYETFKLDGKEFEVPTSAIGGAARVEWEELLNGSFSLNDYYNLVLEGMSDTVYEEIAKALVSMKSQILAVNKTSQSGFDDTIMTRFLQQADAYGKAAIYCTFEFAAKMIPNVNWASSNMKQEYWDRGYFSSYKGHDVIILPQSYTDETNSRKVIDPSQAYIIPTGAEKPIKVAFEGTAQVKSFDNRDWSTEIQTYQKVGVGAYLINPGICVYEDNTLHIQNP